MGEFKKTDVKFNLKRIGDQVFKLLPMREENLDWQKPLSTITIELKGLTIILDDHKELLQVCSKLEGMKTLKEEEDFLDFRRNVFECCGLISNIRNAY